MRIAKRLDKLEARTGNAGACQCATGPASGPRVVYEEDWSDPPNDPGPEVCQNCHRERMTINVKYVSNWRPDEHAEGGTA